MTNENNKTNEIPKKLLAIDCVNGMTYFGKDARTIADRFVYDMFGWLIGKDERISDYNVFNTDENLYEMKQHLVYFTPSLSKKYSEQKYKIQGPIRINHKQIVTVHNLDDLENVK